MSAGTVRRSPISWITTLCLGLITVQVAAQDDRIDFESDRWVLRNAEVVEYLGQKCLRGTAHLKDVEFQNGVIEVDVAVNGERSFPGISFRRQSDSAGESVYIRPHKSKQVDAVQYTPVFNQMSGWQLYNGVGFTASAEIPTDRWLHIKLEVSGTQARIYLDHQAIPVLIVHDLKHGLSKGSVGLFAPNSEVAHFANFRFKEDESLAFGPALPIEILPGTLTDWEMSQPFTVTQINRETAPSSQDLPDIQWQKVACEPPGFVNVSRTVMRSAREPQVVLARTFIESDRAQTKKLWFGYSDEVSIFLNGHILFSGDSSFRSRDDGFLGAMGLHDAVFLNLNSGRNELLMMVTEAFGGWGFMGRLDDVRGDAIYRHEKLTQLWETPRMFGTPESVVYDPKREVLYVSNYYNPYNSGNEDGNEFVSKVKLDGTIEDIAWLKGLNRPTGMCIHQDKLFVVERENLVEIDLDAAEIKKRHPIPDAGFINDVAINASGNIYISDSDRSVIHRLKDGELSIWLQSADIMQPNGLSVDGNRLLVGCSSDGCLRAVDLASRAVTPIASLGGGSIMDGVATDDRGNIVLSDWNGRTFWLPAAGKKEELLNTSIPNYNSADLAYVSAKDLIVIPTFSDGRLLAFKLKGL